MRRAGRRRGRRRGRRARRVARGRRTRRAAARREADPRRRARAAGRSPPRASPVDALRRGRRRAHCGRADRDHDAARRRARERRARGPWLCARRRDAAQRRLGRVGRPFIRADDRPRVRSRPDPPRPRRRTTRRRPRRGPDARRPGRAAVPRSAPRPPRRRDADHLRAAQRDRLHRRPARRPVDRRPRHGVRRDDRPGGTLRHGARVRRRGAGHAGVAAARSPPGGAGDTRVADRRVGRARGDRGRRRGVRAASRAHDRAGQRVVRRRAGGVEPRVGLHRAERLARHAAVAGVRRQRVHGRRRDASALLLEQRRGRAGAGRDGSPRARRRHDLHAALHRVEHGQRRVPADGEPDDRRPAGRRAAARRPVRHVGAGPVGRADRPRARPAEPEADVRAALHHDAERRRQAAARPLRDDPARGPASAGVSRRRDPHARSGRRETPAARTQGAAMIRTRAFTLIELLVVVSVIALLIAILLPSLSNARRNARTVVCAAHAREVAAGLRYYAEDNNGRTMPIDHSGNRYWFHLIAQYLGDPEYRKDPVGRGDGPMRVMLCPETPERDTGPGFGSAYVSWRFQGGNGSYGLNLWMLPAGVYSKSALFPRDQYEYDLRIVTRPSEVPVLGDSSWVGSWPDSNDIVPTNLDTGLGNHANGFFMGRFCIDRHNMAINLAYVDGSARRVPLDELWLQRWHSKYIPPDPPVHIP
ncbi:MAG: prepilin-type N-terminal cleavage/methylation domain-containing protein [Phycisphaera sp.]|nr:prepilin-type N-terminal cleavage/methylation domain-containing protein [Phycisphaera sp.]